MVIINKAEGAVRFIIAIFGNKHIGMLITNIYSILQSNPGSHVTVFWQDIEENLINAITKAFRTVSFIKTDFDLTSDPIKRISSKTLLWNYAVKVYPCHSICILDVDTLVIKNIGHFFDQDFDIVFTHKDEQVPLNTGVMLCKGNKYALFFRKWEQETLRIINDPELFEKANSPDHLYGGSDQMSLFNLLRYKPNQREYAISIDGEKLVFRGIPCKILNEVHSGRITESTHIIHYKGGWQKILLEGQNFTKYRTKALSWEMYILYLKTFKESIEYLQDNAKTSYQPKDFKVIIPFYLNTLRFTENKFLYLLYAYYDRIRNFRNMLHRLRRIAYYPSRFLLKTLHLINPRNPLLWARIGEGVILGCPIRVTSSRDVALGSRVWIEDRVTLSPMGGKISIGDNSHILPYAMLLGYGGRIDIGDHCTVHPYCILYGAGGLKIGDSVRIAAHTVIIPSNHVFQDPETPIRLQGIRSEGVVIKSDVWIGAGVRILDGVVIGEGSVVGAGAVVTKDVPDYAIVSGVPARVTGWRKKEKQFDFK